MNLFAPLANVGPSGRAFARFRSFPYSTSAATAASVTSTHFDIVNPFFMTLQDWADSFVLVMSHLLPLPQLSGDFERWAQQIVSEPVFQAYQLPHATEVEDWMNWANQVNVALASTGAL